MRGRTSKLTVKCVCDVTLSGFLMLGFNFDEMFPPLREGCGDVFGRIYQVSHLENREKLSWHSAYLGIIIIKVFHLSELCFIFLFHSPGAV